LHRVKVSGVVDARERGFWGYACPIYVDKVELLSKYPVVTSHFPIAVFMNATEKPIAIHITGGHEAEMNTGIPKSEAVTAFVNEGQEISVTSATGETILISKIRGLRRSSPYYDRNTQKFFYRILPGKIERVFASEGRLWKWLD
jgi:hypothetical protein